MSPMIAVRWFASTVAIATVMAVGLVPMSAAQADAAAYDDVEFAVIITDAQDHIGFLDIREIALGEPGDGTLVARFRVQDFGLNAGTESFHFFMTTPAGAFRAGFNTAGNPATHSSSPAGFDSCVVAGNTVFCALPYEAIEAEPGTVLTGTYAITYQQAAQDFAPGGYFESSVLGNRGDDYTITGGAVGAVEAMVEELQLSGNVTQTIEGHGSAQFDIELTNTGLDNATVNLTAAETTGDLALALETNSTTIGPNETVVLGAAVDVPEGTPAGEYAWRILAQGVNGGNTTIDVSLTVRAPPAPLAGNQTAGNASAAEGAEDGGLIPGPGPVAVAAALAGTVAAFRRSRRND